jgi:hypothetical protein
MDPYLTARSFSTPLGVFALAAAIDRRWSRCVALLVAAGVLHPLMTGYAAAFIVLFFLVDLGLPRAAFVIAAEAIAAATLTYFFTRHVSVDPAYRQAVLSRSYLFPGEWSAPDLCGLAMPLILLAIAANRCRTNPLVRKLCLSACLFGLTGMVIAFLFVHAGGSLLLVRFQPLRSFHMIYFTGTILMGGALGGVFFSSKHGFRSRWMAFGMIAVVGAIFFLTQRASYPLSAHVELPGRTPRNPWQQAFVWIRGNTPKNAVFAANPHLVFVDGEDAQGFRATAERSLLADDKDEGVVVVFPYLAREWARERNVQAGIDEMTDAEREARVRPLGADWILLPRSAATELPCPYRNAVAQVCRLN